MDSVRCQVGRGEVFSEGAITFLLVSASGTKPSTQALNSPTESSVPETSCLVFTTRAPMRPMGACKKVEADIAPLEKISPGPSLHQC